MSEGPARLRGVVFCDADPYLTASRIYKAYGFFDDFILLDLEEARKRSRVLTLRHNPIEYFSILDNLIERGEIESVKAGAVAPEYMFSPAWDPKISNSWQPEKYGNLYTQPWEAEASRQKLMRHVFERMAADMYSVTRVGEDAPRYFATSLPGESVGLPPKEGWGKEYVYTLAVSNLPVIDGSLEGAAQAKKDPNYLNARRQFLRLCEDLGKRDLVHSELEDEFRFRIKEYEEAVTERAEAKGGGAVSFCFRLAKAAAPDRFMKFLVGEFERFSPELRRRLKITVHASALPLPERLAVENPEVALLAEAQRGFRYP